MANRQTVADAHKRLDTLESGMAELLALARASANGTQSTPAPNPSPESPTPSRGGQPLLSEAFIRRGSALHKVILAANQLEPGGSIKVGRGCSHGLNAAIIRNAYKGGDWNQATRTRFYTRRTSGSGKTVADGKALSVTTPQNSRDPKIDSRLVLTRTS